MYGFFPDLLDPKYIGWLASGLETTLWASLLVSVLATLTGLFLAAARSSEQSGLVWLAKSYISVFRNTPLLVQLFFWYFGAPALLPEGAMEWLNAEHSLSIGESLRLAWPSFEYIAGITGLTLYSTAFIAEEIRAGMQGVPKSQRQAAQALGMTRFQVMRYIVMPQAMRIALPPLLGQYMNVVKSSSLTMAIGVVELSYASRQVETETFKTFQAFGVATTFYIATIALIEALGQALQRSRQISMGRR